MITDDEVMRLFEQADPARADDVVSMIDISGHLDTLRTRSIDMTIIQDTPTPTEPESRRQWLMPALAAAAVVLIVVGGLVLVARDEPAQPVNDQPPVTTQATAIESTPSAADIARGFVEAFGAFDADRAISYLADDAEVTGLVTRIGPSSLVGTPEELRLVIPLAQSMGYTQTIDTCEQLDTTAAGTSVRCTFDYHLLRSDELGLGPFGGSYFDLTVRDGQVVKAAQWCNTDEFSVEVFEPFYGWLSANYPDDEPVLSSDVRITESSLTELTRLWEQRTREYVDVASQ